MDLAKEQLLSLDVQCVKHRSGGAASQALELRTDTSVLYGLDSEPPCRPMLLETVYFIPFPIWHGKSLLPNQSCAGEAPFVCHHVSSCACVGPDKSQDKIYSLGKHMAVKAMNFLLAEDLPNLKAAFREVLSGRNHECVNCSVPSTSGCPAAISCVQRPHPTSSNASSYTGSEQ